MADDDVHMDPGPEFRETRSTRIFKNPRNDTYALVGRDAENRPVTLAVDNDPIDLSVLSAEMGLGAPITMGDTVPTHDANEMELYVEAANAFEGHAADIQAQTIEQMADAQAQLNLDAARDTFYSNIEDVLERELATRELEKKLEKVAELERKNEAARTLLPPTASDYLKRNNRRAIEENELTLASLKDDINGLRRALGIDPDDGPSLGVDKPKAKPSGGSDAAELEVDDVAEIDLSIHETPGPDLGNQATIDNSPEADARAEIDPAQARLERMNSPEWQATLDEMRAARGLDGEAYSATMAAQAERKAARATPPTVEAASTLSTDISEAKKAAQISDTHFANRTNTPELTPEAAAAAAQQAAASRRAQKTARRGKVLRRGGKK
jgi:hypothetical protein